MNTDLFLAILAMNAYDSIGGEVTGAALRVSGSQIGNTFVDAAAGLDLTTRARARACAEAPR